MEGNKNLFLNVKNHKFEELNGKIKDNINIDRIHNKLIGDDDDDIMEYEEF